MTQSPGRPRGTSTRPARQHSGGNGVARVWVMAQEKVAPYHAVMTDKTMAKLRPLLKGYAERVAKLQPQPKATDAEGERRREECGERLQQVVLPVLQAFVAALRGVGHGALIEDHTEGIDGYPSVGLAFAPRSPGALASVLTFRYDPRRGIAVQRDVKPPATRARLVTSSHDRIGTMTVDAGTAGMGETETLSFVGAGVQAD